MFSHQDFENLRSQIRNVSSMLGVYNSGISYSPYPTSPNVNYSSSSNVTNTDLVKLGDIQQGLKTMEIIRQQLSSLSFIMLSVVDNVEAEQKHCKTCSAHHTLKDIQE